MQHDDIDDDCARRLLDYLSEQRQAGEQLEPFAGQDAKREMQEMDVNRSD